MHRAQDSERAQYSISKAVEPNRSRARFRHDLREVWTAPDQNDGFEKAIDIFAEKYGPKYDKAVQCLVKDQ